jgi:hypothetical protein
LLSPTLLLALSYKNLELFWILNIAFDFFKTPFRKLNILHHFVSSTQQLGPLKKSQSASLAL